MPDFILAIDTTGPSLGLGLSQLKASARFQTWPLGREISSHLHTCLTEFIQPTAWTDLACISVAIGPGSYTGTRIGVVTARTLAQQLNIPLFGISALAALAKSSVLQLQSQCAVAVELPAQPEQVYGAIYSSSTTTARIPDQLFPTIEWQQILESQAQDCLYIQPASPEHQTTLICQGLLAEATERWQRDERPHWSEANVLYL